MSLLKSLVSQTWAFPPFLCPYLTHKLRYRIKCHSNGGHFEIQDGCHNRDLKISKHRFPTLVFLINYKNAKISKSPKNSQRRSILEHKDPDYMKNKLERMTTQIVRNKISFMVILNEEIRWNTSQVMLKSVRRELTFWLSVFVIFLI